VRTAIAPLYLLACLLLGGSAQGVWQNAVLQIVGVAIIAWAAAAPSEQLLPRAAMPLLWLAIAVVVLVALQTVPLPPDLWSHGIRERIAEGYRLLGRPAPWLPLSVTPYASAATLLSLIPPLAMFCAIVSLRAYRATWLGGALVAGTLLGVMLGALQVVGRGSPSSWYLYRETNPGLAVGFFANANHMATLLVVAIPFVAAIAASGRGGTIQRYSAVLAILAGAAIVTIVGIVLNGSLAGFVLALPVLAASALIRFRARAKIRIWVGLAAAVALVGAVIALGSSSIGRSAIGRDASTSMQSRAEILRTTGHAIADFMPFGSGLGSFVPVYRLYESPDSVTSEYVVHAHNDYVEIALELGIAGILLVGLFLAWWAAAVWAVWGRGEGGPFACAATIATAAVLVHSLVDFPLRTAAISALFATGLALMADRRLPVRRDPKDLRPTRHLVIG
jgi:O-antigen ligase